MRHGSRLSFPVYEISNRGRVQSGHFHPCIVQIESLGIALRSLRRELIDPGKKRKLPISPVQRTQQLNTRKYESRRQKITALKGQSQGLIRKVVPSYLSSPPYIKATKPPISVDQTDRQLATADRSRGSPADAASGPGRRTRDAPSLRPAGTAAPISNDGEGSLSGH